MTLPAAVYAWRSHDLKQVRIIKNLIRAVAIFSNKTCLSIGDCSSMTEEPVVTTTAIDLL